MSRTKAVPTRTTRAAPAQPSGGRAVGQDRTAKWRCNACTFLSDGDTCQTCGAPKPAHEVKPKHGSKANPTLKPNGPREEKKSEVYFDPVDGSMNVPIAGIKKYYPRQDTEIKVPKVPPPKKNPNMRTIADLEAEAQRPQAIPRGPDGRRDIVGMLQQADNADTLPCMRKPAKK